MTKITSSDYRDYVIRDGRFIGEFDQMYRNVADPWRCVAQADSFKNDLLVTAAGRRCPETRLALDIGCGLGALTERLRAAVPGARWHACDVSPTAVQHAADRFDGVAFFVHDLTRNAPLPFADRSLDMVTMAEVVWYVLPHLRQVLDELARVLRPGGHFLVLQYFLSADEQRYGKEIVSSPADLLRYLGTAGFRVTDEVYLGARPPLDLLACCVRSEAASV